VGFLMERMGGVKRERSEELKVKIQPLKQGQVRFNKALTSSKHTQQEMQQIGEWVGELYYWADLCRELRADFIQVEDAMKRKLGSDTGVWIESWTSPNVAAASAAGGFSPMGPGGSSPDADAIRERYGGGGMRPAPVEE